MTPRIVPAVKIAPPREPERDRAVEVSENRGWLDVGSVEERERRYGVYAGQLDPTWPRDLARPSFFRDLITVHAAEQRALKALEHPGLRGRDPGDPDEPHGDRELAEARRRLDAVWREQRDLGSANAGDVLRPSNVPSWLADTYGQAARQVGTLAEALDRRPLEAGMVDTSSGVPVVTIPRFSGGAAVAVQASQNAAIQETDPTTTSYSAPVGTIAGLVDLSRQLFDFSRPGADEALANDLGRATGMTLDSQIVSGSGASGQLRGLQNVSGILSGTSAATTAQGQISAVWSAFRSLSSTSGFGVPDVASYVTAVSPGRFAWWSGGSGGSGVQVSPNLPGTVVLTGAVPEGEAYLIEKTSVFLVAERPHVRVFEETGSSTLTVRILSYGSGALVVKAPTGVFRLSGLPAMTF